LKEKILRRLKEVTQGGLAVCQPSKHEAMIQTLVPPKKKKKKRKRKENTYSRGSTNVLDYYMMRALFFLQAGK
jgi:hypothetical protein